MNGNFSQEAMDAFAAMVGEENFSEGLFDFTRCVRPDGSFYGTGGKCKSGSEAGAKEKAEKAVAKTKKPIPLKQLRANIKARKAAEAAKAAAPESEANRNVPTKAEKESALKAIREEAAKRAAAGDDKGVDAAIKAYNNVKKGATREESGAPSRAAAGMRGKD